MNAAAEPVVQALRRLRGLAYRVASPADRVLRAARGRAPLPPLWLRRHVGPVGSFESAAREAAATLDRLALVRPGELAIDVGCGCGAMVPYLASRLGATGSYLGIDVHRPSIEWCRRRWAADPRLRFELARVASPYAEGTSSPAAVGSYRFPAADGAAHFLLAKSLFTHLLAEEAAAYLREIRRVLAPRGSALVTAFLFAGDAEPPAFPCPGDGANAGLRWRSSLRPRAAVAYERQRFEALVAAAGLELERFEAGYWPGREAAVRGQDTLVLARAGVAVAAWRSAC